MTYANARKSLRYIRMSLLACGAALIDDEQVKRDLIGMGGVLLPHEFDESVRNFSHNEVKLVVETLLVAVNRKLGLKDDDVSTPRT